MKKTKFKIHLLKLVRIFITYLILFFIFSCDDTITEDDIDNIIIPSNNVSYIEYIQPVFNIKCTTCHDGQSNETNLDLTTWAGVRADASIVVPYYPQNSKLVWSIERVTGYLPMPPLNAPVRPLTVNQIEGIKTWITEGAQYN
ncbi:MAG: hypothetical protein JXA68_02805 [Ignavibacteriales bacterium]|nr:hypothetical protein [Ignavibacteriales bacterium]